MGPEDIIETAFNGKPIIDTQVEKNNLVDVTEYGYSLWLRYMTRYPVVMPNGKNSPWYTVARLTNKKLYTNVDVGDRVLAVFLGQGFYQFTTNDVVSANPNIFRNVPFVGDIEGQWIYIYYSYTQRKSESVGYIQYSSGDV
jgi:hypothetical protein